MGILIFYEYIETDSQDIRPSGKGWEFWGMRKTPNEEKAVWRREEGKYEDSEQGIFN